MEAVRTSLKEHHGFLLKMPAKYSDLIPFPETSIPEMPNTDLQRIALRSTCNPEYEKP